MKKILCITCAVLLSIPAISQTYKKRLAVHRAEYLKELESEPSPLKKEDLKYIHFYDADSTYNVKSEVQLLNNQKPFTMPVFDGTGNEFVRFALLNFKLNGHPYKLTMYKSLALASNPQYKDYLFLPFTDETNGQKTYGGGRYIDFKTGDIVNGKLYIDFNKAYNPYCAYSSGYRCPIPPEENDLHTSIPAGEKIYTGEKKHK